MNVHGKKMREAEKVRSRKEKKVTKGLSKKSLKAIYSAGTFNFIMLLWKQCDYLL